VSKLESKLFGLEFEPEQAFDNLRRVARTLLAVSKQESTKRIAQHTARNLRSKKRS